MICVWIKDKILIYSKDIFFFFSAHFPHQCVVALIFGYLSCQFSVKRIGKLKKFFLAVFCILSALTVYFKAEFLLGFDINWSLQLAHRHCQKVFSYLLDVLWGHPIKLIQVVSKIDGMTMILIFWTLGFRSKDIK